MAKRKPKSPNRSIPKSPDLAFIAESLRPLAVPMADVRLDPKNARQHDQKSIRGIAASLREFGQVKPIVVHRETKTIIAGNGPYQAAQRLAWSHIAVVWVDHDAHQARGLAIADNRTAELSTWDEVMLERLLLEAESESPDLYERLREDLLFDEIRLVHEREDGEGGESGNAQEAPGELEYSIIITCQDEAHQRRLLDRFAKEKLTCRALIM